MSEKKQHADTALIDQVDFWDLGDPFVIGLSVQPGDIDGYQHVNNSVYVRWIDDCAREHSRAVGIDTELASELGYGMAVRNSRITYQMPAYLGDNILVGNWLTKSDGRLRATRQFQIVRPADKVTLVRAELDYICIKIATGKPARMPKLFSERYVPLNSQDS